MHLMYRETGIQRPLITPGDLTSRGRGWDSAADNAQNAYDSVSKVVTDVSGSNEGEATDQFVEFMGGSNGPGEALDSFRADAKEFAQAHNDAADALEEALKLMDAEATTREKELLNPPWWVSLSPNGPFTWMRTVIHNAKTNMTSDEATAAAAVEAAYNFTVTIPPDAPGITYTNNPDRGRVDSQISETWENLSPGEREAILQQMMKEYAEAHGLDWDPDKVTFKEINALGLAYSDGRIELNSKNLNDPTLMHTAVHEVQHQVQNQAVADFEDYSWKEIQEFRESGENPFDKYDLTLDEVEAMSNQEYVSHDEDEEGYWGQPVEADARRVGRSGDGATMSPEDFRGVAERAGVDLDE